MTKLVILLTLLALLLISYTAGAPSGDAMVNGLPPIALQQGWNMVGWPLLVSKPLPDAFGTCWPLVTMVWSYDATDAIDPWENFDLAVPPFLNDLTELRYGHGYWVQVSADCAWTPWMNGSRRRQNSDTAYG